MNIKKAKEQIISTVKAYTAKDELGSYLIPPNRQRPILLMGPPGIGKTAIMEQVAAEMGINLVSYTITHHTRQSAIGLPFIEKRTYEGREYSVTEYTMSEIIAAVYESIEETGIHEGILFLDEINCVSETLAPTMLQFLQYKTFGSFKLPQGFVVVCAGNPPRYNKSVRDFDIVTLDRLKRMDVEYDLEAWREYAYRENIHSAIMSYLEIKKKNFFSFRLDEEGRHFVTARGWEDLSLYLSSARALGMSVDYDVIIQYIQDGEIAGDFASYLMLYDKFRDVYRIPQILSGEFKGDAKALKDAAFDEKLSFLGLLMEALDEEFIEYDRDYESQKALYTAIKSAREEDSFEPIREAAAMESERLSQGLKSNTLGRLSEALLRKKMDAYSKIISAYGEKENYEGAAESFKEAEDERKRKVEDTRQHLENAFSFISGVYGAGQEMVIFLSQLNQDANALKFLSAHKVESYHKYNKMLLLEDNRERLLDEIKLTFS